MTQPEQATVGEYEAINEAAAPTAANDVDIALSQGPDKAAAAAEALGVELPASEAPTADAEKSVDTPPETSAESGVQVDEQKAQ